MPRRIAKHEIRGWLQGLWFSNTFANDSDLIADPIVREESDGTTTLYWRLDNGLIFDLGETSYYCLLPDGTEFIEDNFDATKGLPQEILEFIVKKEDC